MIAPLPFLTLTLPSFCEPLKIRAVPEAFAQARATGARRVVAASYVLAPGHFADVIARGGADVVTAPLAPDDAVARIVAERYLAAAGAVAHAA
ncbi:MULTISPECIES: sirohydrochlorin chelatase [unclassified Microbacterium]|uniref:sirohydrochlorin chelatase n=1 Tax=unclassified Microbacterium TaxID=2609290 RepID=UPI003868413C